MQCTFPPLRFCDAIHNYQTGCDNKLTFKETITRQKPLDSLAVLAISPEPFDYFVLILQQKQVYRPSKLYSVFLQISP